MDERQVIDWVRASQNVGIFLKHRNMIDVVFFATRGDTTHLNSHLTPCVSFTGYWYNIATKNPYIIVSDTIFIKTKDLDNWFEVWDPREDAKV